jgi:hypothetical protein
MSPQKKKPDEKSGFFYAAILKTKVFSDPYFVE